MFAAVLSFLTGLIHAFQRKFFAFVWSKAILYYNEEGKGKKLKLFGPLNRDIQKVPDSKKFKILEIGGGSGANFQNVSCPVNWTVVEPNPEFSPYFNDTLKLRDQKKQTHHEVSLIEGFGEDLSKFADNTFDAAISTLVLCTVQDTEKVLSEIKRVLKPGGKFYFMEHVIAPEGSALRVAQQFMTKSGLWPFLADGCDLTRDTGSHLRAAGFRDLQMQSYRFSETLICRILTPHVDGCATK